MGRTVGIDLGTTYSAAGKVEHQTNEKKANEPCYY